MSHSLSRIEMMFEIARRRKMHELRRSVEDEDFIFHGLPNPGPQELAEMEAAYQKISSSAEYHFVWDDANSPMMSELLEKVRTLLNPERAEVIFHTSTTMITWTRSSLLTPNPNLDLSGLRVLMNAVSDTYERIGDLQTSMVLPIEIMLTSDDQLVYFLSSIERTNTVRTSPSLTKHSFTSFTKLAEEVVTACVDLGIGKYIIDKRFLNMPVTNWEMMG